MRVLWEGVITITHSFESQTDVLFLVSGKMPQTRTKRTICPQRRKRQISPRLARDQRKWENTHREFAKKTSRFGEKLYSNLMGYRLQICSPHWQREKQCNLILGCRRRNAATPCFCRSSSKILPKSCQNLAENLLFILYSIRLSTPTGKYHFSPEWTVIFGRSVCGGYTALITRYLSARSPSNPGLSVYFRLDGRKRRV